MINDNIYMSVLVIVFAIYLFRKDYENYVNSPFLTNLPYDEKTQ